MSRRDEMAFVFGRRLAIPLWAIAFFTVALTAPPPATVSLIAVLGIAVTVFIIPELVRASPSVVQLLLTGKRRTRSGATASLTASGARTPGIGNGTR